MEKQDGKVNYLDYIPVCSPENNWKTKENGNVVVEFVNKGFYNKIAQKFFKRPKISYIELDNYGSYIWKQMDGKRTIYDISILVKEKYGEQAEPLIERISKYFQTLYKVHFIGYIKKKI